jgi:hypothetical protein
MSHVEFTRFAGDVVRYAMTPEIAGKLLEAALTPATIKNLALALAEHLPAHICNLTPEEILFAKKSASRWTRAATVVGGTVLTLATTGVVTLIVLGVKAWAKLKGSE